MRYRREQKLSKPKETSFTRVEIEVKQDGHFDLAAEKYTHAIEAIGESNPKAAPYFSNRAMCYIKEELYSKPP